MAAPTYKNATNVALSDTGTATSPSDTSIGDLVIIGVWSQNTTIPTHTIQSGFTEIRTHSHNDGTTDGRLSVAAKVATAAGAQSYQPYSVTGAATGQTHAWIITITAGTWANVGLSGLVLKQGSSTLTTTGVPNPPSVTGLHGDWLVLAIGAWQVTSAATKTVSPPTNYTERIDGPTASSVTHGSVATRALTGLSNSTEDPGAFTDDFTPNGSVSMTLAIPGVSTPLHYVANSATGATPTGTQPGDLVVAFLYNASSIGSYTGWTSFGSALQITGYFQTLYRIWQSGDTMPTWGTSAAYTVTYRYNHATSLIVGTPIWTKRASATSADIGSVTNEAATGNTALYIASGEGAGTHTPPTNYFEDIDSSNDLSFGSRQNVSSSGSTSGTVTAMPSGEHVVAHFIARQADVSVAITGSLDTTLGAMTLSGTADSVLSGSLATTLGTMTLAGTADSLLTVNGAATLDEMTVSGSGTVENPTVIGTLDVTLDAMTASGTAESLLTGTAAITLATMTVSGTGESLLTGVGAATLDAMTVSGTAESVLSGSASITFDTMTASGTGESLLTGSAAITLDDMTLAATGTSSGFIDCTASITFDAMTASGTGESTITGTSSVTLDAMTASGTGELVVLGTASITLDAMNLGGTVESELTGSSSITLDAMTVSGTGTSTFPAIGDIQFSAMTMSGIGTVTGVRVARYSPPNRLPCMDTKWNKRTLYPYGFKRWRSSR